MKISMARCRGSWRVLFKEGGQTEWPSSKSLQITNVGEDVEKRKLLYTVGGYVNWYSHYRKQDGVFSKNETTV